MLSESEKQEVYDIDRQIQKLQNKKLKINPYSCLKNLSGKAFGEEWSELHILKQCPKLERDNSKGHDFYNKNLGKIELKSFRIPSTSSTANQCYPKECDYFLFAFYDVEEYEDYLYLISSNDLVREFSTSPQHDRNLIPSCFSVRLTTKKNKEKLQKYKISYEELNKLL